MFVSRKKYQEKLDLIEGYRNRCTRLYKEKWEVEVERDNLKGLVEVMQNRIKRLENKEVSDEQ